MPIAVAYFLTWTPVPLSSLLFLAHAQGPDTLYRRPIHILIQYSTLCVVLAKYVVFYWSIPPDVACQMCPFTNNMVQKINHRLTSLLFIHLSPNSYLQCIRIRISEFNTSVVSLHLHHPSNRIFSSDVFSVWGTRIRNTFFVFRAVTRPILGWVWQIRFRVPETSPIYIISSQTCFTMLMVLMLTCGFQVQMDKSGSSGIPYFTK